MIDEITNNLYTNCVKIIDYTSGEPYLVFYNTLNGELRIISLTYSFNHRFNFGTPIICITKRAVLNKDYWNSNRIKQDQRLVGLFVSKLTNLEPIDRTKRDMFDEFEEWITYPSSYGLNYF